VVHLDQLAPYQGTTRGQVALRREKQEQLESNHSENPVTGKEGETDHRRHKHSPQKRRNDGMPVCYSGQIALTRQQYSMQFHC
jgi:hypothetical protein